MKHLKHWLSLKTISSLICNLIKLFILFVIGGTIYCFIEVAFRGYTHESMYVVGGLCFILIGLINEFFTFEFPLVYQSLIGSLIVTVIEFISGYIVNIVMKLNVWDYSNLPLNIMGQICLLFSIMWVFLSAVAIVLDDYLRYWIFDEEYPHYVFLTKFK